MTQLKARTLRIALEIFAALVLGFFFVAGVGIYFLSTGPVSVSALTPMIERALISDQSPYSVKIADTKIVWAGWDRAVDVVVEDVTFQAEGSPPLAVLPEVSVGLSFQALLAGDVRLTTLEVLTPTLTLIRNPDGSLALSFGGLPNEEDGEAEGGMLTMPEAEEGGLIPASILDVLTAGPSEAGPSEAGPLGTLSRFSMIQAEIQIIDQALGESLWLRSVGLDVTRSSDGLDAQLVGTLESSTDNALIGATLRVVPELDRIDATFAFERLDMELPIRYMPDLVFYLPDLTIGGQIGVSFDMQGVPRRLAAKLDSAAGVIDVTADILGKLPASDVEFTLDGVDTAVWLGGLYDLGDALDYAPRVAISGSGRFVIDDRAWPVSGDIDLTSEIGSLVATLVRAVDDGSYTSDISLSDLRLDQASATAPSLGILEGITPPVGATAQIKLTPDGELHSSALNVKFGSGVVSIPDLATLPELSGGTVRLRTGGLNDPIFLDALSIDFGAPFIQASGTIRPIEGGHKITLNGLLTELQMNRLEEFWFEGLAPNPREWVLENIPSGYAPQANIDLAVTVPEEGIEELIVDELSGSIEMIGAEVHYLRPLTPAVGVDGFAEFTADRFDIDVLSGSVNDGVLQGGRIELTELSGPVEKIDIALNIDSPLPTALALLDTEPRRYVSKIGLEAADIDGFANAQVRFSFPLLLDLKDEQVHYEAEATVRDISMPRPELDAIVTAETVSLKLEPGSLEVTGDVFIDAVPANILWRESFSADSDQVRYLSLTSVADLSALSDFGMDVSDFATGRAGIGINLAEYQSGSRSLALTANLAEATLDLAPIHWQKPPGIASDLFLQAIFRPDGTIRIEDFALNGGEHHTFLGAAELDGETENLLAARIDQLRFGRTNISGTVTRVGEVFALDLTGPELDAEPFMEDEEEVSEDSPPIDPEEETGPDLQLSGTFERLHLGPDRAVQAADLSLSIGEGEVRSLTMHGLLSEGRKIDVNYIPTPDGGRDLFILAEDTGLALTVADVTGELTGGTLRIEGRKESPDAPLIGRLEITDFQMRDAPRLAKILEVISVTGILSALSNEGIAFNSLTADFSMTEEEIWVSDGAARGDSIGITVQGKVDRIRDELDLTGEVAVSDLFSKTIGQLPIIELLVGEGLIGAAYTMTGSIEDPSVSVNPLSVIAPGFLRKVFQSNGGTPAASPLPESDRGK